MSIRNGVWGYGSWRNHAFLLLGLLSVPCFAAIIHSFQPLATPHQPLVTSLWSLSTRQKLHPVSLDSLTTLRLCSTGDCREGGGCVPDCGDGRQHAAGADERQPPCAPSEHGRSAGSARRLYATAHCHDGVGTLQVRSKGNRSYVLYDLQMTSGKWQSAMIPHNRWSAYDVQFHSRNYWYSLHAALNPGLNATLC